MGRIILIDRDMIDSDHITRYLLSKNEEVVINRLESDEAVNNFFEQRDPQQVTQLDAPSCIVIDIDFPHALTGMEIIKKFKSHPVFKQVPLFVFTKNTDKHIVANCFVLGVSGYFTKPGNHFTFNQSVKQLVDRWNNLSQSGFGYNYKAV